jgi:hypothetical protein
MRLAVETGIHWRAWLEDPAAMVTAIEVLDERAKNIEQPTTS